MACVDSVFQHMPTVKDSVRHYSLSDAGLSERLCHSIDRLTVTPTVILSCVVLLIYSFVYLFAQSVQKQQ